MRLFVFVAAVMAHVAARQGEVGARTPRHRPIRAEPEYDGREIFDAIDTDGDNKLTAIEVADYFDDAVPEGLWKNVDRNRDGVLTWLEFDASQGKGEL